MTQFDFSAIWNALPYLFFTGMKFTLTLTAVSAISGIVMGTVLASMRISGIVVLSTPATLYVNTMRSIPLLLVIFGFYFLVPYVGGWIMQSSSPLQVGAVWSAIITFSMFEAAYYCEIIRSGIQSIPKGQIFASKALGMNYRQTMRLVILPQAFRNMIPSMLTATIVLFQDTSLVYVLSLTDFLGAATKVAQRDGRLIELYVFVAFVYLVICVSVSQLVKQLEWRMKRTR